MKRGFTLVELLAVIVILAIIALITIPAVMKMIDNATMNSYRRSVDLYGKAVSQAIIEYQTDMVEKGQASNVTFDNIEPYIEYEGNDVDCKLKQIYSDKTILLTECYVDEELVLAEKNRGYGNENYYYYTNSKKKIKAIEYIKAVEEELKDKNITGTCTISEDKITCNGQDFTIKSNLENVIEGTLVIENSKVKSYSNLKFATEKKTETNNEVPQVIDEIDSTNTSNNSNQTQEKYATLVSDADNNGKISIGDKYTYKVNNNDTFNFYVLSIKDDKVNLIMNSNICTNGTVPTASNSCLIAWHLGTDNNNYGPNTAMTYLYNATKNWDNVPNMDLSGENAYEDENNDIDSTKGYIGITTNNGIATITGKNNAFNTTIGTATTSLKARLPREDEVTSQETGCHIYSSHADDASCPIWLVENLSDSSLWCSECSTKYSHISKIGNVDGYWLLSSEQGYYLSALCVSNFGVLSGNYTTESEHLGVRPVITVPISYLQ